MGSDSKLQKQLFCGAFKSVLDERMHFKFKDGRESFVSAFNSKTYKNGALQLISTYSWKHNFRLKWTKLHCTDLHEYKLCCATPTPPTSTQVYLKTQKTSKHVKPKKKKSVCLCFFEVCVKYIKHHIHANMCGQAHIQSGPHWYSIEHWKTNS